MPILCIKKIYLGGRAFAVPPKYIIEPIWYTEKRGPVSVVIPTSDIHTNITKGLYDMR